MAKIVITGASGLLGRALIARLHSEHTLTAFSRAEKGQLDLRRRYPSVNWHIGDVLDPLFLHQVLEGQDYVIHAAALKHVDLSEVEPTEYTRVNVEGSVNVARIAAHYGVGAVGISTDKACSPVNTYGITKLLMERVFAEHGHVCVRYGNVFGSDGSVIPVWESQLSTLGHIRLTHPDMTRFFFRTRDAVSEVLWALTQAPPGVTVVPRLRAVRMGDLAQSFMQARGRKNLVRAKSDYSGDIRVVGLRPGEKLHETLLNEDEARRSHLTDGRVILHPAKTSDDPHSAICSRDVDHIPADELMGWLTERSAAEAA